MNSDGDFIELQGTAEMKPFSRSKLDELMDLATIGVNELFKIQQAALIGYDPDANS